MSDGLTSVSEDWTSVNPSDPLSEEQVPRSRSLSSPDHQPLLPCSTLTEMFSLGLDLITLINQSHFLVEFQSFVEKLRVCGRIPASKSKLFLLVTGQGNVHLGTKSWCLDRWNVSISPRVKTYSSKYPIPTCVKTYLSKDRLGLRLIRLKTRKSTCMSPPSKNTNKANRPIAITINPSQFPLSPVW